ncbi:MAG: F0F1 ATP synthase subunit epsilon [Candidatus Sumerlaeia bacterium]|nr:F0F1 ATP synthase subunit epsilon [Candidatus Sumerlaeia bacterium]
MARIDSLIAPGGNGYLGVLANHAPLITTIVPGRLIIRRGSEKIVFEVGKGFLEVFRNNAILLVNYAKKISNQS